MPPKPKSNPTSPRKPDTPGLPASPRKPEVSATPASPRSPGDDPMSISPRSPTRLSPRIGGWYEPPEQVLRPPLPNYPDTPYVGPQSLVEHPAVLPHNGPVAPGEVRGLDNLMGENNCFLNVVIQSLWHLRSFSSAFIELSSHTHSANCVVCELQSIFTQFQFAEEKSIPPRALRQALAALYYSEHRFQLGSLADATEAFVRRLPRRPGTNLADFLF